MADQLRNNYFDSFYEDDLEDINFEKEFRPHFSNWRCPVCNEKLFDEEKDSIFYWCPRCKVYYFKREIDNGKREFKCPIDDSDYISTEIDEKIDQGDFNW